MKFNSKKLSETNWNCSILMCNLLFLVDGSRDISFIVCWPFHFSSSPYGRFTYLDPSAFKHDWKLKPDRLEDQTTQSACSYIDKITIILWRTDGSMLWPYNYTDSRSCSSNCHVEENWLHAADNFEVRGGFNWIHWTELDWIYELLLSWTSYRIIKLYRTSYYQNKLLTYWPESSSLSNWYEVLNSANLVII